MKSSTKELLEKAREVVEKTNDIAYYCIFRQLQVLQNG
jgi:hypothetical protein